MLFSLCRPPSHVGPFQNFTLRMQIRIFHRKVGSGEDFMGFRIDAPGKPYPRSQTPSVFL
jgi:hypothetical protein